MIFYQQGAVIDKQLTRRSLRRERQDTAVGAVLTQLITIMMVLALAATGGLTHPGAALNSVGEISEPLRPFLGSLAARLMLGAGLLGAAWWPPWWPPWWRPYLAPGVWRRCSVGPTL